eukprot:12086392-Alexandrium_andersonii.AAC.1
MTKVQACAVSLSETLPRHAARRRKRLSRACKGAPAGFHWVVRASAAFKNCPDQGLPRGGPPDTGTLSGGSTQE